jgi:hypothetical protein
MADETWREAERRWLADPTDQGALAKAITACRRAGRAVPPPMLDAELLPPTAFDSKLPLIVQVESADGAVKTVGATPSRPPLRLPRCRAWWVTGSRLEPGNVKYPGVPWSLDEVGLERLLAEVARSEVSGLAINGRCSADATIGRLAREAGSLRSLTLTSCYDITAAGFAGLAGLNTLRRLDLSGLIGQFIGGKRSRALDIQARELLDLRLNDTQDVTLGSIPPGLCRLAVRGMPAVDKLLPRLKELGHLTHLDLCVSQATDRGAMHLAKCAKLLALDLKATRITDKTIRALGALDRLEVLRLDQCDGVTDEAMTTVAGMVSLRELRLDDCRGVSAKGVERLANLEGLRKLYLRQSKLRNIELEPARAALRKALPKCKVY